MFRFLLVVGTLAIPAVAQAAPICAVPKVLPRPHLEGPSAEQPARRIPIGGYTLALIWQPQHCRTPARGAESMACEPGTTPRGFVLHGLWPDGHGETWPQYCRPAAILPPAAIKRAWCATPSAQLLQHEWAKHGTCVTRTPDAYFAASGALFRKLRFPDLTARREWRADALAEAVAGANRGLSADMIKVTATRDGWLEELWLCLDRGQRFTRCKGGGGVAADAMVKIAGAR